MVVEEVSTVGLSGEANIELLHVVQEALTNVRRHSKARNAEVKLRTDDEAVVVIEVADDGRGFDATSMRAGVGLSAMRERVEGLGGAIEVSSRPGEGTKVMVKVPLGGVTGALRLR